MKKPLMPKPPTNKFEKAHNAKTMPHERDEIPDGGPEEQKPEMRQAYDDLQRGLVDTDLHGERGVEDVVKANDEANKSKNQRDSNSK